MEKLYPNKVVRIGTEPKARLDIFMSEGTIARPS